MLGDVLHDRLPAPGVSSLGPGQERNGDGNSEDARRERDRHRHRAGGQPGPGQGRSDDFAVDEMIANSKKPW